MCADSGVYWYGVVNCEVYDDACACVRVEFGTKVDGGVMMYVYVGVIVYGYAGVNVASCDGGVIYVGRWC